MKAQNSNYYFKILYSFSKGGMYCIKSDYKNFNEYRFYNGIIIDDWPDGIKFVFDGEPINDFLIGGLHWKLVSENFRQVFIKKSIPGIQFLPIKLFYFPYGHEIGPYWAINVFQAVTDFYDGFVRGMDVFRLNTGIFVSRELKDSLERANASSGISFIGLSDKTLGLIK